MFSRLTITVALLAGFARAPMQCGTRTRPETAREESPAEALWTLSERFGSEGNTAARTTTLQYIIERYPGSRFASRARDALGSAHGDAAAVRDGG